ncbi:hypothetical protein [Enterococcus sp. AZ101]|uniref:hypothetical protein n=1 Tax=Enterococcus sp. AZ101 TaxID=2774742 RepID=UPI003D283EF2
MTDQKRKKIIFGDVDAIVESILMNRAIEVSNPDVCKNIEPFTNYELKAKLVYLVGSNLTNDLVETGFNLSGNIMHVQPSFTDVKKLSYKCIWEMTNEEIVDQVVNEINELFLADDEKPTMSNDETEKQSESENPFADIFAPTRVFSKELKRKINFSLQKLFFDSFSNDQIGDGSWDFPGSNFGIKRSDRTIATVYAYLDEPLSEAEQYDAEDENRFLIYQ